MSNDRAEAELFSDELQERARLLLREGASIDAVADGLRLPLGAVRHLYGQVERERCARVSGRKRNRPNWSDYDPALVTKARHKATSGSDAAAISAETTLPLPVCEYITRRAAYHKRRAARKAAGPTVVP